jgi:hypothetical protein
VTDGGKIVLLGIALSACTVWYEAPTSSSRVITLHPVDPAKADGATVVQLLAEVPSRASGEVTFETSDGVLNFATSESSNARLVTVSDPPRGELGETKLVSTPMRVGRTPGLVLLKASLAGFSSQANLFLDESPPTDIVAESNASLLELNGTSRTTITIHLLREAGEHASLGTNLLLEVCCATASGQIAVCPFREPLRVPRILTLTEGDSVAFDAVTEPLTSAEIGSTSAFDGFVLVHLAPDPTEQCMAPSKPSEGTQLRLRLAPHVAASP